MRRLLLAPFRLLPTLARHRFLFGQIAWRAFAARHAGSFLGWLWAPLSTALQFALYFMVFSVILQIKVEGLGIDLARRPGVGFGVFLITGLVPYLALNEVVLRASRVFRAHATLVQRVRFPAEVLVLGDACGALLHHAVALAAALVVCVVRGHLVWAGLPWLGLGLALLLLWTVGLSLLASVVGAYLPDVAELLALALQLVFYCAPIVYPLAIVHAAALRTVVELNPLTSLLGAIRAGLLGAAPPSARAVLLLGGAGLLLVALGAAAVERWRDRIPDAL
jgi:lipopolysaccharide transport system permease protein